MKALLTIVFVISGFVSFGQCNDFRQDYCDLPSDWPYKYDSQSKSAELFPGQTFRIKVVLYEGYDYYIGFCLKENRENFYFNVKLGDLNIDENFNHSSFDNLWTLDLSIEKTVIAIIEVKLNSKQIVNYTPSELECLDIIIGNKVSE